MLILYTIPMRDCTAGMCKPLEGMAGVKLGAKNCRAARPVKGHPERARAQAAAANAEGSSGMATEQVAAGTAAGYGTLRLCEDRLQGICAPGHQPLQAHLLAAAGCQCWHLLGPPCPQPGLCPPLHCWVWCPADSSIFRICAEHTCLDVCAHHFCHSCLCPCCLPLPCAVSHKIHSVLCRFALPALLPLISPDLKMTDHEGALLTVGYTVSPRPLRAM